MKKLPAAMSAAVVTAVVLAAFSVPALAQWQTVGGVTMEAPQDNQVVFRSSQALVAVSVLAPGLIRVRMVHGSSFPADHSYAVIKTHWPDPRPQFSSGSDTETIRTAELEVRAHLAPFRLAFYDSSGRLLSQDDERRGMAWDGPRVRAWKRMPDDEQYFGLGEKAGPLDRRGHTYVMWNTDAYGWGSNTDPLYEDIPFFIGLREGRAYGIFFDNTYRSEFDFGVEDPGDYSFGAEGGEMNYYFLAGPDPKQVIERFTELVGRMPLPARWAIAYHQSRYSYYPESDVRFIADNFRERHIPCDALFLDIHYMNGYRVFTWDKTRFPDPARLLVDLRQQGFHVVTIVDPGVKVDPDYSVYTEGLAGRDFATLPDGRPFVGEVWPGKSAFPDFTLARVRDWWGSLYKGLLSDGVSGIWNDMNEPSVFNVPSKTMPPDVRFAGGPHTEIHNVYGMLMSEATYDGLLKLRPNERPLVITRDTYAGGQRYSAVWTGDNSSTWEHLRLSLPEILGMGMSGLTLAGADIGGFVSSPSPELYTRWLEAGVFYPYCRTHTEFGSRPQEPWSYGYRLEQINRRSIDLRYRLLPYLYDAFVEASATGLPVMRALLLDYPDDSSAIEQNYEFMFGDDLLVAPVVKEGETRWNVYLPRGDWYDFWSGRRYTGLKNVTVDAPIGRVPLFVRGGAIIPTQQVVEYTAEAPINPLTFEIYPAGNSSRDYYEDDGSSLDYQRGVWLRQRISVSPSKNGVEIEMTARQGSYHPPARSLELKVHAVREQPSRVVVNGRELTAQRDADALGKQDSGWAYDENANVVWVKVPDEGAALTARIER